MEFDKIEMEWTKLPDGRYGLTWVPPVAKPKERAVSLRHYERWAEGKFNEACKRRDGLEDFAQLDDSMVWVRRYATALDVLRQYREEVE